MVSDFAVRRVHAHDAPQLAVLRHAALSDAPAAFAMSESQLAPLADPAWQTLCERHAHGAQSLVVAYAHHTCIGMAGCHVDASTKMQHCGMIWGVYVTPAYRGQGVATQLLQALIAHGAQQQLRMLKLSVTVGQQHALRLYEHLGFVVYAHEPALLYMDNTEIDALHMVYRYTHGGSC